MANSLVCFGGNSLSNKEWINSVANFYRESGMYDDVLEYQYVHWNRVPDMHGIDFQEEMSRLKSHNNLYSDSDVFAKSAGCLLILSSIKNNLINPPHIIFVGLPLKFAQSRKMDIEDLFSGVEIPILIIQNSNDPEGSCDEVANLLENLKNNNISLTSLLGDTHYYIDIEKIIYLTRKFISRH